jgi:clan AA aspartic protease
VGVGFRISPHQSLTIEFVVDTGFAGALTLPPTAIASLGLPFVERISASLADSSTTFVDAYAATIVWDGEEREVAILATGDRPLLGTLLLDGFDLQIQFMDGGLLTLERI